MGKGAEMSVVVTSLAEYLSTTYHPDRDYVDGELQERNVGEFEHAAIQAFLTSWFFSIARSGSCMSCRKCGSR
jgi:hypothetical protein